MGKIIHTHNSATLDDIRGGSKCHFRFFIRDLIYGKIFRNSNSSASYISKDNKMFGGLVTLNLSDNRLVKMNDLAIFELFEDPITEDWINQISELSYNHYSFIKLSGYQEFLFDRYLQKLDDAVEDALDSLDSYDIVDIDLDQDLDKSADRIKGVFDHFLLKVFSTVESILTKIDTNQELVAAFYVLYTIYAQMEEDHEIRIQVKGYNPLFYKTLRDFTTIYAEVFHTDLPLPEAFQDCLFQERELNKCVSVR